MRHICLSCGSIIDKGKLRVLLSSDEETLDTECPICLERNQQASFEEILKLDEIKEKIKQLERRRIQE